MISEVAFRSNIKVNTNFDLYLEYLSDTFNECEVQGWKVQNKISCLPNLISAVHYPAFHLSMNFFSVLSKKKKLHTFTYVLPAMKDVKYS